MFEKLLVQLLWERARLEEGFYHHMCEGWEKARLVCCRCCSVVCCGSVLCVQFQKSCDVCVQEVGEGAYIANYRTKFRSKT